jgi:DNA invertase Pin-like site-specific DNA recombinase
VTERFSALYGRVSTVGQGESLETQLGRLRVSVPGAVEFVDAGVSGRAADRPAFDRLVAEIRSERVGSVTVTKLDRLGRSAKTILEFFNDAEAHQVRVVVLDQALDTSTPVGRLVRTILAAMAELEADMIAERTREAMAAFKAGTRNTRSGKPVGRPRRVNDELVAEIRRLRDSGLRWAQVAVRLHVPASSARKWLSVANQRPKPTPTAETPPAINRPAEFGAPKTDRQ